MLVALNQETRVDALGAPKGPTYTCPNCRAEVVLKQGRIVALDTTRNLLTRYAGVRVRVRLLPDRLPEALVPWQGASEGDSHVLQLPDYAALERMLALLRESAVEVQDLEVMQADLEEVFVHMMHKS